MENLFLLLFFASLICLIVGLIKPTAFSRFIKGEITRKKISLIFGIASFVFIVLFGITPDTDKTKDEATQNKAQTITQSPTPTATQSTPSTPKYTYDIPALLGKNIDEIRSALGDPNNKEGIEPTEEQKKTGIDIWDNMYTKNNQELLITFNPVDRKIIDFFLSGENKSQLLKNGNANENNSNYKIEDVKDMSDSSKITGIKIIPR